MAYDMARARVVLFGGSLVGGGPTGGASMDTWEWTGVSWIHRPVGIAPPARFGHAMAYDWARGRVVVFGGNTGSTQLDDT